MPSPTPWSRVLVLCLGAVVVAACAGSPPEVPLGPDGEPDPVLVQGRDVYDARCANCHGASGGGGAGSRLAGVVVDAYPDPADQAEVIRSGRDQMPSFAGTLSDAEIDAVVRYTREILG